MQLREKMHEQGLSGVDLVKALCMAGSRMSEAAFSFLKNGMVLPTPQDAKMLCELLQCGIFELYDREEIDFSALVAQEEKEPFCAAEKRGARKEAKIQFRIDDAALNFFNSGALARLGYRNKTEWFREMVRNTRREDERRYGGNGGGGDAWKNAGMGVEDDAEVYTI